MMKLLSIAQTHEAWSSSGSPGDRPEGHCVAILVMVLYCRAVISKNGVGYAIDTPSSTFPSVPLTRIKGRGPPLYSGSAFTLICDAIESASDTVLVSSALTFPWTVFVTVIAVLLYLVTMIESVSRVRPKVELHQAKRIKGAPLASFPSRLIWHCGQLDDCEAIGGDVIVADELVYAPAADTCQCGNMVFENFRKAHMVDWKHSCIKRRPRILRRDGCTVP